jgi:N-acetylneuraminate synthase
MISDLRRRYPDVVVGYSDHTLPDPDMEVLVTAVLLGAEILEKHFTFDKTRPGNDHYHAMDAADLRRFRARVAELQRLVGADRKAALPSEQPARLHARRSLVAARRIRAGERIASSDLTTKRPAHGISPLHVHEVVGRTARHDIEPDTILQWSMLE